MKKLLLFVVLIGSTPMLSQETEEKQLLTAKASLEQQITVLKDSLQQVNQKIESLRKVEIEKKPIKKISPGPNELIALEKLKIRSEPDLSSKVVLELEKEIPVLKIDVIGDFYLVCYKGTCGYAPRALLEDSNNEKKKDERGSTPNS